MTFFDIAKPMAERGVPQIRVRPSSKAAFDKDWPSMATTDLQKLAVLSAEMPDCNSASVAQARIGGFFFLEVDSPEVVKRIEQETGQQIPATFRVRSRPGRGHFYWKHTASSIAMGNLSQTYVRHGDFSVRADNQYVVSAKSIHPHSQQPYVALNETDQIIECPEWLIAWLLKQKVEKKAAEGEIKKDAHGLIEHGYIHGWLVSQAGRLRNIGLDIDTLETALVKLAEENCAPPLDLDKVRQVARSFARYEPGQNGDILFTQSTQQSTQVAEEVELPTFENEPYPVFPRYVMESTSIYENLVKPVCDLNSRIDYFMWLPATMMLLNYVAPKIRMKAIGGDRPVKGGLYQVLIGKAGKTNKSSSVDDAKNYFNYMGCLMQHSRDVKNADGKILTFTVGSAEGLGTEMQKTNCKNVFLDYDELSILVSKIGIESSSLVSALLLLYESSSFSNGVKSGKESYSIPPNSYCASLIANTTSAKFAELWSKLAGSDTGLDDRFMFTLEPEILPEPRLFRYVNTVQGSAKTKVLIEKAIQQGVFDFEETNHPRMLELNSVENRLALRAERWALALAIDLGLDVIDGECVERAVDIVKYEIAVKKYLKSYEALTREAEIQLGIHRTLEMAKGRMAKTALKRKMNAQRYGTSLFNQAYKGLMNDGVFREEGAGTRSDPIILQLLRKRDIFDE